MSNTSMGITLLWNIICSTFLSIVQISWGEEWERYSEERERRSDGRLPQRHCSARQGHGWEWGSEAGVESTQDCVLSDATGVLHFYTFTLLSWHLKTASTSRSFHKGHIYIFFHIISFKSFCALIHLVWGLRSHKTSFYLQQIYIYIPWIWNLLSIWGPTRKFRQSV